MLFYYDRINAKASKTLNNVSYYFGFVIVYFKVILFAA